MFDSPFSIMVFSVFPIFFIFRFAYLAENENFLQLQLFAVLYLLYILPKFIRQT